MRASRWCDGWRSLCACASAADALAEDTGSSVDVPVGIDVLWVKKDRHHNLDSGYMPVRVGFIVLFSLEVKEIK